METMDTKRIANILYNMSLDMDYADTLESYDEEINLLENDVRKLKEEGSSLYYALESIAESNDDMFDWAITKA